MINWCKMILLFTFLTLFVCNNYSVCLDPICAQNEVYKTCQSSTCGEEKCGVCPPVACTKDCVNGCFCQPGYKRNNDGMCRTVCLPCGLNELWSDCGNPCRDPKCNQTEPPICPLYCNPAGGCFCIQGFKRDLLGKCVVC